jgi:hypothetical protein
MASSANNTKAANASQKTGDAVRFGLETMQMKKFEPDNERLMERLLGKGTTRDSDTGQLVPAGFSQSGYGLR